MQSVKRNRFRRLPVAIHLPSADSRCPPPLICAYNTSKSNTKNDKSHLPLWNIKRVWP